MSSAGVAVAGPQAYFCYQCNRTVTLTPSLNSDLACPNCNGGFLEEFDSTNQNPNPNPFSSSAIHPDPFSLIADPFFSSRFTTTTTRGPIVLSSTTIDLENPTSFSSLFSPRPGNYQDTPAFNAFDFLQGYLQNLRDSGANVQFVVENRSSEPGVHLPPNFGDYFLGPGLEQLIQQLAENDPNRYGTQPASKRAVEGLRNVVVTEKMENSDSNSCAVCMNGFEVGLEVKQMPCKHLYHSDCLLPWLELHNSCPVCRYELPTDDPDYEPQRSQGQGSSSRAAGGTDGGSGEQGGYPGSPNVQRRFRISLPWPFSVLGSSGGNNDGGAGNNDVNRESGASSDGQQGGSHHGSEPRQESLD